MGEQGVAAMRIRFWSVWHPDSSVSYCAMEEETAWRHAEMETAKSEPDLRQIGWQSIEQGGGFECSG